MTRFGSSRLHVSSYMSSIASLLAGVFMLCTSVALASAQSAPVKQPPVIDIHVHTFGGGPGLPPMCPWPPQFLASDPKSTESTIGWSDQNCVLPLKTAA